MRKSMQHVTAVCVARDRGYRQCKQSYVPEHTILDQVVVLLKEIKAPPEALKRIDKVVKGRKSNGAALEHVRQLEEQMERTQYSWEQGLIQPDAYVEKMHQLEREIASMRPLDYDKLEEAYDLITHFRTYWDQCAEVKHPEEAWRQLMAKVVDRVFVYDDKVVAIALPSDFGVVLDMPMSAPIEVLTAVSAASKHTPTKESASIGTNARTQCGDDGVRTRDLGLDRAAC
jgi:hypothetical protein